MEFGGELRLAVVAAAVEDGDGDPIADQGAEQDFVAALDVLEGEVHLPEAVVAMVVGSGDPDDEVGREFVERVGEGFEELLEIHFAFDEADGFDIERAGVFFGGVVSADVDGVGKNAGVIAEDGGGAVSLVGIGIDDHDFDVGLLVLEVTDGDGDVVEDAISFAMFAEGMMGAAGEADAYAFGEGGLTGEAGGFDFGCGSQEEFSGDGQAEEDLLFSVECAGLNFFYVTAVMDAEEVVEVGWLNFDDFLGTKDFFLEEHFLGNAELIHREGVSLWEVELK